MQKQIVILFALLFWFSLSGNAQEFVKTEGITSPFHQAHIGMVTFMADTIPLALYKESDFLKVFELKEKNNLYIRTFMGTSLVNYLHPLAPEWSTDQLTHNGNFQFTFYVDGAKEYVENLNAGAGGAHNKTFRTLFRVPLVSNRSEDSWGRFLWTRFMVMSGEDALSPGAHLLKIEIRPYVNNGGIKPGAVIAQGELTIHVPPNSHPVSRAEMRPQTIAGNSGWPLSGDGYDKEKITTLNSKIAENVFKDITSIVVIKDGKLLLEEYFNGSGRSTLHDTRSVGKSFASALMGIAIQDKFIKGEDQMLKEFYDLKKFSYYSTRKDSITIKSLLTMSSAFNGSDNDEDSPGNEEKMYPTQDWVKFALDLPVDSAKVIHHDWNYFTAGVILLGDILHKSVPGGLENFAREKLFEPLGIRKYQWEYTPQKVANTAGGLRMASLDYARFGQLYKNAGAWSGRQVIPSAWVKESLTSQLTLPPNYNGSYGYLFWEKSYQVGGQPYETFYCSGNGGNKIFIFTQIPLVVVITSTAFNKMYSHPQVDRIMEHYILPAVLK